MHKKYIILKDFPLGVLFLTFSLYFMYFAMYFANFPKIIDFILIFGSFVISLKLVSIAYYLIFGVETEIKQND